MTMAATRLEITRVGAAIGASITGVDLKQELPDDLVAELRAALLAHKVVFFPGQHLTPAEHVAFGRRFGELTPAHPVIPGIPGHPEVFEIDYQLGRTLDATYGPIVDDKRGIGWHTDVTYVDRPPMGSILNAMDMPAFGGDTMWSNQVVAYETLSAPVRRLVDELEGLHDGRASFKAILDNIDAKGGDGSGIEWDGKRTTLEPVRHPAVRTHPETGERGLYVNPGFTTRLLGVAKKESEALLAMLFAHATRPELVVRHQWRTGDLAFWDNRASMHSVLGDYGNQPRRIHRVTLRGDEPR